MSNVTDPRESAETAAAAIRCFGFAMRDADPAMARHFMLKVSGRQPCCGATNPHCATPMREVTDTLAGCENCGHPKPCHA